MKKILFPVVIFGSFILSGCTLNKMVQLAKDQQLTVIPNPLEVHKDTVSFEVSALLPLKMLKPGKSYTLQPKYVYNEKELELEEVEFKADDYPNANEQQPSKSQNYEFAYMPEHKKGDLVLKGIAKDLKNGKTKETESFPFAEGVITTSQLVKDVYYAAYANHGYNTEEEIIATNVDFFFDQGRSVLKRSEIKSDRGDQLIAFIAEKNVTRTVAVTGTHSPEGTERINSNLSKDRAAAIEKYYRSQMKKYDYKGLTDSIKFILKPVIEDWGTFKTELKKSTLIPKNQKEEYLKIVNGSGSFEEKENEFHKLSSYNSILDKLYPELRTAQTEILSVKPKKTKSEIAVLSKQVGNEEASVDTLTDEELMYGATLTPDLDEKWRIYEAATKHSDSWNSHNNLGVVYLLKAIKSENEVEMKELIERAATQLELSVKRRKNAEAYGNLGVVYFMQGNAWKALNSLNKAFAMDPSNETVKTLAGVKGACEIVVAKYPKAVSTLSDAMENPHNLFNKGLAQLLNKQPQNAMDTFGEVIEKDANYAIAHYGTAIAAARLNQSAVVVEKLKAAYDIDPELKGVALSDLEFRDYWANEDFVNAMK